MHPLKPDADYMRAVVSAAAHYRVDSFELCGDVHSSTGNIDGAIRFRDYPTVEAQLDHARIDQTIQTLREVVDIAHASGRPIYYWHREVMVPPQVVQEVAGLLDENREFNLLGEAYQTLLRSKLREFFDNVPGMDGIVLTVTESDYSVIHNSDPERYPPAEVIRHILTTLAGELSALGKRLIVRSFGSIAQDYEDILAGAARVDPALRFEIETKITPYDFSPFLPLNPFLRRTGLINLSAEYDSIGEFLGAGFLPAADPQRVLDYVAFAREQGVHRHVIRVDRIGHPVFTSPQAIHLLAFDRAIADPTVTADAIWHEWSQAHWPACAADMTGIMQRGIEVVKKTHFIDGHVIFHAFPIHGELKWLKACGIFSVFKPEVSLAAHVGMWGILTHRITPTRAALLREKDEAVAAADTALAELRALRDSLSPVEFTRAETAWENATVVARLIREFCRCVCAYFEDMETGRADHPSLSAAVEQGRAEFQRLVPTSIAALPVDRSPASAPAQHEYGDPEALNDSVEDAYAKPLWRLIELLRLEYRAEWSERTALTARGDIADFIVCGGLIDDHRVHRYMHASHAALLDGRPARAAGNRVFPNGFMECRLKVPSRGKFLLRIAGAASKSSGFRLTVNGKTVDAHYDARGVVEQRAELPPGIPGVDRFISVRIQKSGANYPWIHSIAAVTLPGR